jgi:hypothetical protein
LITALIAAVIAAGCTPSQQRRAASTTAPRSSTVISPVSTPSPTDAGSGTSRLDSRAELAARALHLPALRAGQACPTSHTTVLNTIETGRSFALGQGPVRPLGFSNGTMDLTSTTFAPGWLAAKTLWISDPAYQGPFLIRLRRIDAPGPVGLDESPGSTSLYTPGGPTGNGANGSRDVTGATWVKTPGCVAWQVDGINFSNVIIARLLCRRPICTQPPSRRP